MAVEVIEVATTVGEEERKAQFTYDLPTNLEEAKARYGEELVFEALMVELRSAVRSPARKAIAAAAGGLSQEEYNALAQGVMDGWKFGEKRVRVRPSLSDPIGTLETIWGKLTPELQKEVAAKFGFALPAHTEEIVPPGRRR